MPVIGKLVIHRLVSKPSEDQLQAGKMGHHILQNPVGKPTAKRLASWLKAMERTGDSFGASIGGRVSMLGPAPVPEALTRHRMI